MAESARRASPVDPTHYPVSEEMPEPTLQRLVMEVLRPLIQAWLDERGEVAFAGADQFIYWVQHQPTTRMAPDVYVLPGVPKGTDFGAWKVWETGVRPSIVIEIVGSDPRKDYEVAPGRYDEMGVEELVVFDPWHDAGSDRVRWQVWRRTARGFVRVERTDGDRVRSQVLGCWLRLVGSGADRRVRVATGPRGEVLLPTAEERASAAEGRASAAEAEAARLHLELESLKRR